MQFFCCCNAGAGLSTSFQRFAPPADHLIQENIGCRFMTDVELPEVRCGLCCAMLHMLWSGMPALTAS